MTKIVYAGDFAEKKDLARRAEYSREEFERLLRTIKEYERIRDNYAEHAKTEQKPKSLPWIKRRIATLQEEAREARPPAEPEDDK